MAIRLNKFLASQLAIGRRQADELIANGKVTINGERAELGSRVKDGDSIQTDGKVITAQAVEFDYMLMDKPVGYVCSRRQQGDTPTIYSLLPPEFQHLKTVGRLDKDSSGLILLTNDGDFAHTLTHPSFSKIKKYEVTLDKALQPLHHQMIADHGVSLADGVSKFELMRLHDGNDQQWLVTMREGRNRQIRRTFAALGYDVTSLRRIQFGPYSLDALQGAKFQATEPRTL